jgi:hypothetical protein
MNLKSVLLSAPVRVGGAPAAKKYEHGGDVALAVDPPFVLICRRSGDSLVTVGIPIVSVQQVEFEDVHTGEQAERGQQADAPRTRKRRATAEGEQGEGQ